jgi:uncharacterized protein YndB with AHSA1/START domain
MEMIDVGAHVNAPIERVWEFLSDQEGYTFAKVVTRARLLQEGHNEKDGVGAVVKVRALGFPVTWNIVGYEPPNRLEYRITRVLLPMRHEIGAVEFKARDSGTDVRWTSRFDVPVPLISRPLGSIIRRVFSYIHQSALLEAKDILEAQRDPGGTVMRIPDWIKKALKIWIIAAVIGHALESPFAYRSAKKRGLDPRKYFLGTLALGAIVYIPLLRKPKLGETARTAES